MARLKVSREQIMETALDSPQNKPRSKSSQRDLVSTESVAQFVERVKSLGTAKMVTEHNTMKQKERHITRFMANKKKNRYPNVVLFNEGAVVLDVTKHDDKGDDYIHATKLKGKFGNYVLAQSPKRSTVISWLRMIWQLKITIILSLIPLNSKDKCAKYFEKKEGKKLKQKYFLVKTLASRIEGLITTFDLKITNKYDPEERMVHVLVFDGWPEVSNRPESAELLNLVRAVWALEETNVADKKCPTLIYGVSGTRRTGTYVLLSMLCKQMTERGELSLIAACSTVRSYRYNVMSSRHCFVTLLNALFTYAADNGLVDQSKQGFKIAREFIKALALQEIESRFNY